MKRNCAVCKRESVGECALVVVVAGEVLDLDQTVGELLKRSSHVYLCSACTETAYEYTRRNRGQS